MKIMIIGDGKIGSVLAEQLSREKHEVTLVDRSGVRLDQSNNELDVMVVEGDGASRDVQLEAGADQADLVIACTGADELNLLCCMFAKKVGHCRAIARVRNPAYSHELDFIKQQLNISTIINPELASAQEISRLLCFPAAMKIDTFAEGRVGLIKFQLNNSKGLDSIPLRDLSSRIGSGVLICAVERGEDVVIPSGGFILRKGDIITILATQEKAAAFFGRLGMPTRPVRSALIVGGGTIGYYLAKDLLAHDIRVRIVEHDTKR